MPPNPDLPTTSVLLIDGFDADRSHFVKQLKQCSPDYQIIEAADGLTGLDVYRSRRIDCVVLEIELPDRSGFEVLKNLIPNASKPQVAVIALTQLNNPALVKLAEKNGAYVSFVKQRTSGEDLYRAIQRAVAFVRQLPKED